MNDEQYMHQALALAKNGLGWVNPNPLVGAIIVKNGQIIGRGWHERYGRPHAEAVALAACAGEAREATLYVNLEPCCHHGKNPPCTDAIVAAGISRVAVGATDPNPLVAGEGIRLLRQHGVEVTEGVLAAECQKLNTVFFHYITNKTPYVTMKYAMTMDGKIAAYTGEARWISSEQSRRQAHEERHRNMAIMVGIGTVLADDPLLNCRLEHSKSPIRIICDTYLGTPLSARVVLTAKETPTIIATACLDEKRHLPYTQAGCQVITLPLAGEHIHLRALMKDLGERGIDSVLLEGGATLNWSALEAGLVHKTQVYIAPKLLGGATAPTAVAGLGRHHPDEAIMLANSCLSVLGPDILIESEVVYGENGLK